MKVQVYGHVCAYYYSSVLRASITSLSKLTSANNKEIWLILSATATPTNKAVIHMCELQFFY